MHVSWRERFTTLITDALRFLLWGSFLLDGIALAVMSVYLVVKFCSFFANWMDRTAFSHPW